MLRPAPQSRSQNHRGIAETPLCASAGDRLPALMMAGEKGKNTEYTVTIKEICKTTVDIEADSFEEARAKVEAEYWRDPSAYCLEPEDTFFE